MSQIAIKVLRAFCIGGKAQPVGKVLEVGIALAVELIANRKAEKHVGDAKPAKSATKEPKEPKE